MKVFYLYSALGFLQACVVSIRRGFSTERRTESASGLLHCDSEHAVFDKLYFTSKTVNSTLPIWSSESVRLYYLLTEPIAPQFGIQWASHLIHSWDLWSILSSVDVITGIYY